FSRLPGLFFVPNPRIAPNNHSQQSFPTGEKHEIDLFFAFEFNPGGWHFVFRGRELVRGRR
ncbi:MAG: hypothetical protein LBF41_05215, partial [Deltaproteobacteria bacterium]|nr:hypothetical protein [Deltaproteobacteria bacterium]